MSEKPKPKWSRPDQLGRELTAKEMLGNLEWFMTHCHACEAETGWAAPVCEHCGAELELYAKN